MISVVTGGLGFIGLHLCEALAKRGDDTIVLDNGRRCLPGARQRAERAGVRVVDGDIRDVQAVRDVVTNASRVYHLAAQSNVLGAVADLDYSFSTNVVGTYQVLRAAQNARVERVVFTSSREVYGEVARIPVTEDSPMQPKNAYGASKAAGELYSRAIESTGELEVSVLRLANVFGAGDHDRVIPIWLDRVSMGKDLELYGGSQVLDLAPVGLVIEAIMRAGEISLKGQAINIGSGKGTTLLGLAARVQSLPGVNAGMTILPPRSAEVTRFVADIARMTTVLGLAPPEDALSDLIELWGR